MDPDAALREIRALVHEQLHGDKPDPDRLAELVDGLDGWLGRGGFPPAAWSRDVGVVGIPPWIDAEDE
jgi:hypothetical protein